MTNSTNRYWGNNGKHQKKADALQKLIPQSGPVNNPRKNKALETFRKAVNCYYDLYNNGLCNRARLFASVFGLASSHYGSYRGGYSETLYRLVEDRMDEIVVLAAVEQGIQ